MGGYRNALEGGGCGFHVRNYKVTPLKKGQSQDEDRYISQ